MLVAARWENADPVTTDAPAGLQRIEERPAVVIRLLVVGAVGLALVFEPRLAHGRAALLAGLVVAALVYALVLGVAAWRGRRLLPPRVATAIDAVLALVACGLTGGATSVMVAILPLVVIAGALRGGAVIGRLTALAVGAGFTVAAVAGSGPEVGSAQRWLTGAWWTGYLVAAAVLVGILLRMLERQFEAAAEERARAMAEHEAFLEERDLRSRLLAAQDARMDGVRVVLHEFRTPVASLTALATDLAAGRLTGPGGRRRPPVCSRSTPCTCGTCSTASPTSRCRRAARSAGCGSGRCGSRSSPTPCWTRRRWSRPGGRPPSPRPTPWCAATRSACAACSPTSWRTRPGTAATRPSSWISGTPTVGWWPRCATAARACHPGRPGS